MNKDNKKNIIMTKITNSLRNKDLFQIKGYCNGEWIKSEKMLDVHDPGLVPHDCKITDVYSFGPEVFKAAVVHAHKAFGEFKNSAVRERATLLDKLYHLLLENEEDLVKILVHETGKARSNAVMEVRYAAGYFQWYSELAAHQSGDITWATEQKNRILYIRQPIGVCAIITPWNLPLAMIARSLGAALAAGCTAVVKPGEETPLSALALAHLVDLAGFSKGVVNILPTSEAIEAGKTLCEHPLVKNVTFTGSTSTGKLLMSQSASTMKKCTFELGGLAPFVVFGDADLDLAVENLIMAKAHGSGQTCVCPNRVYIEAGVYDIFMRKLVERLATFAVVGYGMDENTTFGPLTTKKGFQKVCAHVRDALDKGAKLLFGGAPRPELGDNYHDVTVLGNVSSEMLVCNEETFGPVFAAQPFSDEKSVLESCNDASVGLASYVFTKDVSRVFRFGEGLESGMVVVNNCGLSDPAVPFGGVKESGSSIEGSDYGLEEYTATKMMLLQV